MRHYLIACVLPFLLPYSVLADKSTQQYLTEGNHYLISGQFNHALASFDAAIRNEPDNYLTYFKRATAYLSLGRHSAAADDFTTLLALKPDFEKALLERAGIYLKQGNYDLAMQDLEQYLSKSKEKKAKTMLESTKKAQQELRKAETEKEKGRFESCISLATSVFRTSPLLANARLLRAQCHVALGEMDEAAGDFARVVQLNPNDPTLLILLTKINFYSLFEPQAALVHIKQCLHYDPEHKQCKALFKKLKKLDKDIQAIEKEIGLKKFATASNRLIGTPSRQGLLSQIDADMDLLEKQDVFTHRLPRKLHAKCYHLACTLYGKQNENEDKIETWCSKALSLQEDDADALMYRAQVYLNRKDYEAAVRDLEKANQVAEEGSLYRIRQLLQQAQQKLKLSKKRDYYKLLDVSPHADSREIKKAYRKKAHEWHPDKYSGELDKEQVERKMAEINQAYEVLSDPDKRQQYDNGFDPYDPEQGNGPFGGNTGGFSFHEGGFPFSNGFPFGGGFPGGAEFKMHFQH